MCEKLDLIDYEKKRELDDYDTFTCLKFPKEHQLFLKKMQTAFNWYINVFLDNEASLRYKKLIETIGRMSEDEWDNFEFSSVDKEISSEIRKKGIQHYSKFINRSLAVLFPSRHFK